MEKIIGGGILDSYFDDDTLSIHLKEKSRLIKKNGKPGGWTSQVIGDVLTREFLNNLILQLFQEAKERDDGFIEIDRQYSKVLQIGPYRTVIVLPPLSDAIEITVVKPIFKLSIKDYNLSENVLELFLNKSQGILISGAPGEGKTTFAQALSQLYVEQNKIVKTIESPRDLLVGDEVVQYSFSYGTHSEIRDILLLTRPDFTIYDEVRNSEDFILYKDLRLTGIGLIGVIHATNPVDSIQRLIGTIEMGVIPQVIDTVVFIKGGKIDKMLTLEQVVKVPAGMESDDLSRPVILVKDYENGKVLYEIYSYGEQVVVMPLEKIELIETQKQTPKLIEFGIKYIQTQLDKYFNFKYNISPEGSNGIILYVSENNKGQVIGKGGAKILELEKKLGVRISVRAQEFETKNNENYEIKYLNKGNKKIMIIKFGKSLAGQDIVLLIGGEEYKFYVDKRGDIEIKKSKIIQLIENNGFTII